jgi:hypothetical protein
MTNHRREPALEIKMNEVLKTTEEVAKTAGKAADLLKEINAFLFKILGPPAEEVGHMLQDYVRYYRHKNLLRLRDKVEAIYKKRRIEDKTIPIPPRYAITLIESASTEDDESLQEMWAGLITNVTDPNKHFNPKRIYIEILSSLEPLDVKVLKFFSMPDNQGIDMKTLIERTEINEKDLQLSLQNLARLGCVMGVRQNKALVFSLSSSFGAYVKDPLTTFKPSPLGFELIKTCETESENE